NMRHTRTMREYAETHNRLAAVLDAATEVAIIAVDQHGIITVFNSGAERMLRYTPEEVVGQLSSSTFHDAFELDVRSRELAEIFGQPVAAANATTEYARQGSYEEREWTFIRKDGERLTVSLVVTAVRDADG